MTKQIELMSQGMREWAAEAVRGLVALEGRGNQVFTGILIDRNRILTPDVSVELSEDRRVLLPHARVAAASLHGRDPGGDLALWGLAEEVAEREGVRWAGEAQLGELVLGAWMGPDGLPQVALGMVSAVGGAWRCARGGKLDALIRIDGFDARAMHGAVVVNASGAIVGMVSAGIARGEAVLIPALNLRRFAETIAAGGQAKRGYLGVGLQPVPEPPGMIVLTVEAGSPAAAARLMVGDVVLAIGGMSAADFDVVQDFLEPPHVGERVPLRLYRAGTELEVMVEIGQRPATRRVA